MLTAGPCLYLYRHALNIICRTFYVTRNGTIEIDMLYEAPFTVIAPTGPEDIFHDNEVDAPRIGGRVDPRHSDSHRRHSMIGLNSVHTRTQRLGTAIPILRIQ